MIEFSYQLPYPPSVNHVWMRTKKGMALNPKARAYREEVIWTIGEWHYTLQGRIAVKVDLYMPDKRCRDIDNTTKACLDAMTHARVWKDDSQIDQLIINRRGVEAPGRAIVTVRQI